MAPRITALCQFSYPGLGTLSGADTMMHSLLKHLCSQGWHANAVAMGTPEKTVRVDDIVATRTVARYENLRAHARGSDVIITHLGATQVAKKVGRELQIPVVQLIHNTSTLTQAMLGTGRDFVIYNSEWIRDNHKVGPSIVVRPPAEMPQVFGGNPDGYITMINMTQNKGPEIFYSLAEMNPSLKFMAILGGYDVDKQDIRPLPNVRVSPFTIDLPELLRETSVLLIPSKYESYSRVAVEAMAHGIPVIASDTPGLKECLGPIGTHERAVPAFQAALMSVLSTYSARSCESSERYSELLKQTESDLELFESTMRNLANGADHYKLSREPTRV